MYAFSFVYRGNYRRDIYTYGDVDSRQRMARDESGHYFIDLTTSNAYIVEVEEGIEGIGAEGLRIRNEPLRLHQSSDTIKSGNTAMQHLTKELKAMDVTKLGGNEARDILERRDLEDILFT